MRHLPLRIRVGGGDGRGGGEKEEGDESLCSAHALRSGLLYFVS